MNLWTRFLIKNAFLVTALCLGLSCLGGYYSVHLFSNLKTDIEELLPTQARSVLDLNEVRTRLESTNNINLLVLSEHPKESRAFVTDLAHEIDQLPRDVAAGVEYRINQELQFFNSRKSLFIDLADLEQIRDFIKLKIQYEIQLYNPLTIFENKNIPEPKLDLKAIEKKYTSKVDSYSKFPDGYYASRDEKMRVLIVNLPGSAAGIEGAKKLRAALDGLLLKVDPKKYASDIEVHFTGGVQDLIEEHEALIEDLALSTLVVCLLVTFAMLFYFRSFVGTLALLMALFVGTLWTFGLGFFQVGYLNANSAFMGSIVIGNGINFGIILLARFMEERRKHKNVIRSVAIATERTYHATLVAAGAAALAYGSLMLTSFRGFRQFGVIGFTGMVFCWIAAYSILPSLLIVFYRMGFLRRPVKKPKKLLTNFITDMVKRYPKPILLFTAIVTLFSIFNLGKINSNMIETDMKKLRNRHSLENGSMYWANFVDQVFERYLSPIVLLPKKNEDVERVAAEVRKVKEKEGDKSFIVNVSTLNDFLPKNQNEKIKTLNQINNLLPKRLLTKMSNKEQELAKDLLSPHSFNRFDEKELPELVRSKFREKDGTIGKLVLVEPSLSPDLAKSENLIHFVSSVRAAADQIEPGTAVAGTLPVTADLFESIVKDGPKATLLAFLAVFFLVLVLFRDTATVVQCSFALLMGVLWLFGYILGFNQKINFLNFIALPITFGIGVDYGVNVFQRYREEKSRGILRVLRETGGAVMLASLTTITGYGSLLIASNQAFNSFGKLAIMGELTCVFAAVVSLPALIWYWEEKDKKKGMQAP